ncbi:MAG: NAD(+) synthase [Spirochaetales bacterium]|nr:NAD(+) synthase [Spirochaetales bacterium]
MRDGFIKVATATPKLKVGNVEYNRDNIIKLMKKAKEERVKLLVFPELTLTCYTLSDLFFHPLLQKNCLDAIQEIKNESKDSDLITIVGLPLLVMDKLFNVAAVIQRGSVLALIPKTHLPSYSEFYETRWFTPALEKNMVINFLSEDVVFGKNVIIRCENFSDFRLSVEICEDLWAPDSPSTKHALNGATVIANLSASDELIGKEEYRRELVRIHSGKLTAGYLYCDTSTGESSTDMVFTAHNLICEDGSILTESVLKEDELLITELDVSKLSTARSKKNTFRYLPNDEYQVINISLDEEETKLTRAFYKHPFVPSQDNEIKKRAEKIITLQALGLKKRIEHTNAKSAVIGLSGGLDSTLALLVTVRAFDMLSRSRKDIIAITMPCFGTTKRTKSNAELLATALGVTFMDINIKKSVESHFKDINQSLECYDVTYENGQARERTQVLMDVANKTGGLVIGTGDLSELALGWATYNGDHMSMYAVNSSIPKTLVRYLVKYFADFGFTEASAVLYDILATPVSPELLPSNEDGTISQVTEDLVGPYELHDFFLYYFVRHSFSPKKIKRLSLIAFKDVYNEETIDKWLTTFVRRFFNQQFKRSCLPDGPKVGTITLSPRSDWRMPSDAVSALWLDSLK